MKLRLGVITFVVLVAAYPFVFRGTYPLSVGIITGALADLAEQSPRLVVQLEKSGKTRQARKTYRVTPAGMESVRGIIRGAIGAFRAG